MDLKNGEEILKNLNNNSNNGQKGGADSIDFETLKKMKGAIDKMQKSKDDPRSNLLLSLKPYLKESRKDKVDQYIKLLGMSRMMEVFGNSGGEKKE